MPPVDKWLDNEREISGSKGMHGKKVFKGEEEDVLARWSPWGVWVWAAGPSLRGTAISFSVIHSKRWCSSLRVSFSEISAARPVSKGACWCRQRADWTFPRPRQSLPPEHYHGSRSCFTDVSCENFAPHWINNQSPTRQEETMNLRLLK